MLKILTELTVNISNNRTYHELLVPQILAELTVNTSNNRTYHELLMPQILELAELTAGGTRVLPPRHLQPFLIKKR